MKDLHIKLNYGEQQILDELKEIGQCTYTDIISTLLEMANNELLNQKHLEYLLQHQEEEGWQEELIFRSYFQDYFFNCIENRQ